MTYKRTNGTEQRALRRSGVRMWPSVRLEVQVGEIKRLRSSTGEVLRKWVVRFGEDDVVGPFKTHVEAERHQTRTHKVKLAGTYRK